MILLRLYIEYIVDLRRKRGVMSCVVFFLGNYLLSFYFKLRLIGLDDSVFFIKVY